MRNNVICFPLPRRHYYIAVSQDPLPYNITVERLSLTTSIIYSVSSPHNEYSRVPGSLIYRDQVFTGDTDPTLQVMEIPQSYYETQLAPVSRVAPLNQTETPVDKYGFLAGRLVKFTVSVDEVQAGFVDPFENVFAEDDARFSDPIMLSDVLWFPPIFGFKNFLNKITSEAIARGVAPYCQQIVRRVEPIVKSLLDPSNLTGNVYVTNEDYHHVDDTVFIQTRAFRVAHVQQENSTRPYKLYLEQTVTL